MDNWVIDDESIKCSIEEADWDEFPEKGSFSRHINLAIETDKIDDEKNLG